MLEDVNTGVAWTRRHAARYGGDPDAPLLLVGQSAGGQLALMALLNQVCGPARQGLDPCTRAPSKARRARAAPKPPPSPPHHAAAPQAVQAASGCAVVGGSPRWHPRDVGGFVGVSGAYDLEGLAEHLHRWGLGGGGRLPMTAALSGSADEGRSNFD
jgi:prenylcysteine alpha-carboxyl methylesterase